jgi:CTD small phosphatase-like protein 2
MIGKPDFFASPQTCTEKENSKRQNQHFFGRQESHLDKTKLIVPPGNIYPPEQMDKMNLRSTFKEKFQSVTPKAKSPILLNLFDGQFSPSHKGSERKGKHKSISKIEPVTKPNPKNAYNLIKNPRVNSVKNSNSVKPKIIFPSSKADLRLSSKTKTISLPKSKEVFVSDKFLWLDKKLNKQIKLKSPPRRDNNELKIHTEPEETHNVQKIFKDAEKAQPCQSLSSDEQLILTASSLINVEFLKEVNIELLLTLFAKLLTFYCFIEQKKDTYLVTREYTEIVQFHDYIFLDKLIAKSTETGQDLILAFKLEILSVMTAFYYTVECPDHENSNILKIVEKISFNFFCFLNILKKSCEKNHLTEQYKLISNFLETSNAEKAFKKDIDYSKTFKKSNGAVLTLILSLAKDRSSPIYNERLKMLIISIKSYSIIKSCEKLFEFFAQVLKKKGIIMAPEVESKKGTLTQVKIEDTEPNFILQPFNFVSLLPPKATQLPYTLVLDLDETLVHYEESDSGRGQFFLRPHAQQFIIDLEPFFEIVIFTAAMKNYADWIIDRLDTNKLISHRLYRCSTKNHNGVFIKDLSRIGRELSKTIIVDNNADNFQYQPENGIFIKSWYDDAEDNALVELSKVLTYISKKNYPDIRLGLKDMREKMANPLAKK